MEDFLFRFEKALAAQRNQDSMNVNVQKAMDSFNLANKYKDLMLLRF